jgi:hypothetical protein
MNEWKLEGLIAPARSLLEDLNCGWQSMTVVSVVERANVNDGSEINNTPLKKCLVFWN